MTGNEAAQKLRTLADYIELTPQVDVRWVARMAWTLLVDLPVATAAGMARVLFDRSVRGELLRRALPNPVCRYCKGRLTLNPGARDEATVDHVVPRCQGGVHDMGNLVLACRHCNSRKGGRTPEQAGMVLQ